MVVQMPETLQDVARDVELCQLCPLHLTRTRGVPGDGRPNAEVMFIGEGPGFHEDQQGRPFVGPAGQLLNDMLRTIGLRREDVFITNVVRSRPPGNRDPLPAELAACDAYTLRQIAVIQPRIIVTLGRFSMARFFGPNVRITAMHGQTTRWQGITCLAMFHPAAVLRTNTPEMRRLYAQDFRKIPELLEALRAGDERQVVADAGAVHAESPPERVDQLPLF